MTVRVRLALTTLALGLLAPASFGQSVLYTFDGDSAGDYLGRSVSCAGDVNGDGIPDLIVGAYLDDNNGANSGSARVFSGVDGSVLYTFDGKKKKHWFGWSVSGAGDVNGDGFADVVIGAPHTRKDGKNRLGSARVFSGKNGKGLFIFHGNFPEDQLGYSVSGAGDVNGDGLADVIVGAPYAKKKNKGTAWVLAGPDGSVLHAFHGDSPDDHFGWTVSGAGDLNGDGFGDLLVGAPFDDKDSKFDNGSAQVFSGKDGSVLYTFTGDSSGDFFGSSVSGAGDVNGDGFADVIVGTPLDDNNGTDSGSARVFSGFDGLDLYTLDGDSPGDVFGFSVSGAGDVNGDGYADVIVGARWDDNNGTDSGSARVFSGVDGSILYTLDGDSPNDYFGVSVSGAGDANADSYGDLIVGAIRDDNNGNGSGSARVISGCDACVIGTNYCGPANLNSTGQSAVITATGSEIAQANLVTLSAAQLPQQQFGYFLNSQTQGFVPFAGGSQGNLCLGGAIGRHNDQIQNSGITGEFTIQVDLTMLPTPSGTHSVVAGETWNFQAWFRDNNPGPTSNFTDGVSILFL